MRIPITRILILLSYALVVCADEPLPSPARHVVQSPAHKYIATVDPRTGVEVRASGSSESLWTSTNWFRVAFLADDGEHFVTGYDGLNLIPKNYTKDLVLVTFWRRDKKIRDVTVGELFPDTRVLEKTVSHFHWGSITGITNVTLIVSRCDGKMVRLDVTTGKVTK